MMVQVPLIKCDCPECNCPAATTQGVCFECVDGNHVTHWKDTEPVRGKGKKLCLLCGQNPCDCARDI